MEPKQREKAGSVIRAVLHDLGCCDAMEVRRALYEATGELIDWHEFADLLEALVGAGALQYSKARPARDGFTVYEWRHSRDQTERGIA